MNPASITTQRSQKLDERLAAYLAASQSGARSLLVNLISEIERLELTIAQQCESIEAAEAAITDIELDTLDDVYGEQAQGKQKSGARFTNDHQRRREQRARLKRNQTYAALVESRRGMTREKARLSARLHKLEAYRAMLLADEKVSG